MLTISYPDCADILSVIALIHIVSKKNKIFLMMFLFFCYY